MKRGQVQSKAKLEEDSVYRMYYDFTERVEDILPHRTLAINRGEKEGFLTVKVLLDDQQMIDRLLLHTRVLRMWVMKQFWKRLPRMPIRG